MSGTRIMSNDDHLVLVPVVDIVLAYLDTQENVTCVSNVATRVGLQFLAQSNGGKYFAIANQYIYIILCALTMDFWYRKFYYQMLHHKTLIQMMTFRR